MAQFAEHPVSQVLQQLTKKIKSHFDLKDLRFDGKTELK